MQFSLAAATVPRGIQLDFASSFRATSIREGKHKGESGGEKDRFLGAGLKAVANDASSTSGAFFCPLGRKRKEFFFISFFSSSFALPLTLSAPASGFVFGRFSEAPSRTSDDKGVPMPSARTRIQRLIYLEAYKKGNRAHKLGE